MAKTTMTPWEKEWMEAAPQDCMRTFVLNPDAPGGYSEYGETMLDFTSMETLTDVNGQAGVSLIKMDAPAPLNSGTFIRMYLFGSISDGVPVWETEDNGEPKNYRNFYINSGNARWFERHPTGHVDRWRHDYKCEEVIACLKDYPIRSIKTFAEGAYTFGECLDIAFKLAFRPRSVGKYAYSIKPFPDLDAKNSKLVYSNCTLYDVVCDIGRIIDATPSMEIVYEDGVYTFELRYIDRYGLEGELHDIKYFDMQLNDATNMERDSSAGSCISNVENLVVGESSSYPHVGGIMPADTNIERSWEYFELPYPIEEVEEVDIYWEYEILRNDKSPDTVYLYNGESYPSSGKIGDIMFRNPIAVTREGYSEGLYSSGDYPPTDKYKKTLYLREYEEYNYLYDVEKNNEPTRKNTIYYKRGENKIYLNALFNNTYRYWFYFYYDVTGSTSPAAYANFSSDPGGGIGKGTKYYVAVKFKAMLNGVIRGANSKPSDYTAFFNQQGQVISIQSFGTAVNNYTKSMFGENRVACHYYYKIGRREMYAEMPRVGSSVIDKERGKRYVVTDLSFTRKMRGGLLIATLAESRAGKSRVLIAGNSQKCYAIPRESVVDSMSHTHILCKMGVQRPFDGESSMVIEKPYLFNAFLGTPHGKETQPTVVDLSIETDKGVLNSDTDILLSRMRLSAIMSFRMLTNHIAKIQNGEPIPYTDGGRLGDINFNYKAGSASVAQFSQTIDKDAYEILNHTTQVSWVEYGNLRIGESLIDMSYFGDGNGLSEPLQLVLLSSRMRLSDSLSAHTEARYDLAFSDSGTSLDFTASGLTDMPEHVGWAIARGDKVILLDNFDILTDNTVKVYYQVEVRN